MSFRELGFSDYVCAYLEYKGYNRPEDLVGVNLRAAFVGLTGISRSEVSRLVDTIKQQCILREQVAVPEEEHGHEERSPVPEDRNCDAETLVANTVEDELEHEQESNHGFNEALIEQLHITE